MSRGKLRIIGGVWRRHQLPIAPVPGLRPSPDRVRETLFNWLGQDCSGFEVLDLFCGTGALGFEAASRGASAVDLVDSNAQVIQQLRVNARFLMDKWSDSGAGFSVNQSSRSVSQSETKPDLRIHAADVQTYLKKNNRRYDLIFMDPPFDRPDLLKLALATLAACLKPGGLAYIEWGHDLFADLSTLSACLGVPGVDALRQIHAGQVHGHLVGLPSL